MYTLKSYSCSKCGGILNVDRDQDILDCPFCGAQIDYIDFHRKDLLTQADYCLFGKNFKAAKEKYDAVLLNDPGNFLALRGVAFCAGDINSEKDLEDPINLSRCFYNGILRVLCEDRYRQSPDAKYFEKLSEVITKAQEYNKFNREKNSSHLSSVNCSVDSWRKSEFDDNCEKAQRGMKVAGEEYAKLYAELKTLEPEVKSVSKEKRKLAFGNVTPSSDSLKIGCDKCGGALLLDKERKLYMCSHCGIAYGYSLFYGDPIQKAMAELKSGDFESADQRFKHILMFDQNNCEALCGRVLCAGKWKSFALIKLSEDLLNVNWQLVFQRADECIEHQTDQTKLYISLVKETLNLLKKYSDTLVMTRIEPNNTTFQEKLNTISKRYPHLLSKLGRHSVRNELTKNDFTGERLALAPEALSRGDFVEADACYNMLILVHPNDPVILRARILCAGNWTSFLKANVTDYRSDRLFASLSQRVDEALESAPEEYHSYFDMLFKLVSMINNYHENEQRIKECKAEEDKINQSIPKGALYVNNDEFTEMWTELSTNSRKYEGVRTDIRAAFKKLQNDLLKMESELFNDNVSS